MNTDKKMEDSSNKSGKGIKSEDSKERVPQHCEKKEENISENKTIMNDTGMDTSKKAKEQQKKAEKKGLSDSILKKYITFDSFSNFFIPILTAIIAGLVVALLSPFIQDWHTESNQIIKQDAQLERISLGMNKGHLDDLFGHPIFINPVSKDYTIKAGGNFISAAYKLHEKSLLCLYQDEKLVSFVVMTTKKDQYTFERYGLYEFGTDPSEYTYTVSDFTYTDYNENLLEYYKGYYPITGTYHLLYYYEVSGGTHPNNYEYTILGTYRNYMDDPLDAIYIMQTAYGLENHMYDDVEAEKRHLNELREKIHPDVYGLSKYKEFDFVKDVIQNDDNSLLLTADN